VSDQSQYPALYSPRKRPGTCCTRGWIVPTAGMDECGKSCTHRDWIPDHPARNESLYRLSYPGQLPGLYFGKIDLIIPAILKFSQRCYWRFKSYGKLRRAFWRAGQCSRRLESCQPCLILSNVMHVLENVEISFHLFWVCLKFLALNSWAQFYFIISFSFLRIRPNQPEELTYFRHSKYHYVAPTLGFSYT